MPLIFAVVGMTILVAGVVSTRLMLTTGLESIDAIPVPAASTEPKQPVTVVLIDKIGLRWRRTLMRAYGPRLLDTVDVGLRRAGRPEGLVVLTFAQRHAGFVVAGIVGMLLLAVLGQPVIGVVILILTVVWMPYWLWLVGRNRIASIERDLPDFLDVLGVTVSAGLNFRQAVARIVEFHDGPLAQEMLTALREMDVGVSRRAAFMALRDRLKSENVSAFVTALLQAEELGVPLSDALQAISGDVRRARAQQVRQQAARTGPMVSMVVTMTIVPGAMILIIAGLLLGNSEAFGGFL